jgi:hypothetical protein
MSGGGKGGKQTTEVKIPAWLQQAAQRNLARADEIAQIGYVPYFGPDVAAFTPMQQAAFQNTGQAAQAFGMAAPSDPMAGMPAPQTFAGGVQGYSSAPMFQQSLDALAAARPGQFAALQAPFINPITGADPASPFGNWQAPTQGGMGGKGGANGLMGLMLGGGNGGGRDESDRVSAHSGGGYTGLRDMFDGGGPGTSGSSFSGGGMISGAANMAGISPLGSR